MQTEIPTQKLAGKKRNQDKLFDIEKWETLSDGYDTSKPHKHNYFEILIFFKGGGLHEIDFTQYQIKNNSLHFVPPNAVHLLRRGPESEGATILFSEDIFYGDNLLYEFFKGLSLYNCNKGHVLSLSKKEFRNFESLFQQMNSEITNNSKGSLVIIKSLLSLFLAKSDQLFELNSPLRKGNLKRNQVVEKYKTLIEENFLIHKSVRAYAEELHISPKHLNDLCKQNTGLTAQKIIHERLLLEIKRLLIHTDITIKEVCYQTGFDDPAHFNHFFRFHLNLTPLEYRKSTR